MVNRFASVNALAVPLLRGVKGAIVRSWPGTHRIPAGGEREVMRVETATRFLTSVVLSRRFALLIGNGMDVDDLYFVDRAVDPPSYGKSSDVGNLKPPRRLWGDHPKISSQMSD